MLFILSINIILLTLIVATSYFLISIGLSMKHKKFEVATM